MNNPVKSLKIALIVALLTLSLFTICFAAAMPVPQVIPPAQAAVDPQFEYVLAMAAQYPVYGSQASERLFPGREEQQAPVPQEGGHLNFLSVSGNAGGQEAIEALDEHGNVRETYQVRALNHGPAIVLVRNDGCSIAITLDKSQKMVSNVQVQGAKGVSGKELYSRAHDLAIFLGYQPIDN